MAIPADDFVILGLDASTTRCGYGAVEHRPNGDVVYIESGTWHLKSDDWLARAHFYAQQLDAYLAVTHVDLVAIEAPYIMPNNPRAASQLSAVYGFMQCTARNADFLPMSIEPAKVKQLVTGKGNADKPTVARFVLARLGIDHKFKTDDESDALAVAIAAAVIQQSHGFG